jgi:hypothetical protein
MVARIPIASTICFGKISNELSLVAVLTSSLNSRRIEGPAHMLTRFGVDGVITTDIVSKPEYNHFNKSDAFRRSAAGFFLYFSLHL